MTTDNSRADALTDQIDAAMELAHRWATATYHKGLSKPYEDFDEIRKQLRAALWELAAPPVEQPRTHTTQPGESVAGIALRQCGNENEWQKIIALNPEFSEHTACDYFPVGTVLTLPPRPIEQPATAPTSEPLSPGARAFYARHEARMGRVGPQQARATLDTAPSPADERAALLEWAVERWDAEVKNRPLINVHRRSLDDTWRQVIRHLGGDDVSLLGPRHDALLAANPIKPMPAAERFSPAALIVRDCCETDPDDPKEPSTICISHETLTEIVERHTTVTACCGRSECGGECGNEWRGMRPAEPMQTPAAYLYTLHGEDGSTIVRAETGFMNPFGVEGEDYPEGCRVTCERLYATPQPPAQADAREGLTDEQREAIDFVIGWYEQSTIASNPYHEHIAALRALLQGANQS
ncbi:hypothetical protein [Burkholderia sp. Bp8990]|uniref:hypothetical protein n=1 Tax=Burkholderia sp. Bp8990 TaxID=2184552 RepID=UPI001623CA5E|nr:hypothetical protein [Burkholderia sp. Bp8990]